MNAVSQRDFQVRNYTVAACTAYLREIAGEQEAKRIIEGFSPQARQIIASADGASAAWCPVSILSEVITAVAARGNGDEDRTRETLIKCGSFMAHEATNTFLRLLMKMMTPGLFAKKIPDIWRRDCTHGNLLAELGENKLSCRVMDTDGFVHALCTIAGFLTFAVGSMGKSIVKTTVHGWSLQNPNPSEGQIELVWAAR
jgi:hypothetical protein